jgi:hypothetical protein
MWKSFGFFVERKSCAVGYSLLLNDEVWLTSDRLLRLISYNKREFADIFKDFLPIYLISLPLRDIVMRVLLL